ncbi:MAG: tetratricopeptide repeat protein [Acidobacteriota bacterium]|nr:tetratricopeptide repeat protein [Acidobacteriota bacterium]
MYRKRTNGILVAILAFAIVFTFTSCEKLRVSKLKANYHFSKANNLFREGMYRKAITEYENALKSDPNLIQAYRFLGESYKSLFKPGVETAINKELETKALDALKKAHEIEPNNKEIIYSLGDMYDKIRNFDEAEKLYLRILELEPQNMSNYYVVAEFYKRYAGEKPDSAQKAESMYLKRIEADPENPQGYAYVANYYENLPASADNIDQSMLNFDKAALFTSKRIELQPDNAEAWLAMGINRWSKAFRFQNLTKEQRLAAARESQKAIEKARDLDPNYPEPYSWLSVLYKSVLSKLEPDKEARYNAEADRYIEKFQDLRKRAAERKKLEDELKKSG